jgi:ATP-dependent helicase/nuclease subunit B
LGADAAGQQVIELLQGLERDRQSLHHTFSFPEWRTLVGLQLESTDFIPQHIDRRVVMLPLNGARLRAFDAVLLVGADIDHLPSQPAETLFFANAVRRELGLATRESLQRQQLRDFVELLSGGSEVVLSWQAHKNGEPNAVSPWIERLQLAMARNGLPELPMHRVELAQRTLTVALPHMPAPSAPQLLPKKLSASAYNKLVACPYQFFAARMLGLSLLDELSDLPQKRDYGDWLHQILKKYHDTLGKRKVGLDQRAALLREISESIFGPVLIQHPAALGYYVRWQKAMPAYLDWANERESQGWLFSVGEKWHEKKLQWPGGEVVLHGRIDRIDENAADECAVLDYKTTSYSTLKKKLDQRGDHQLAFYGLIADQPVTSAHYVALELHNDKTRDVGAPRYDEWQRQLSAQIADNLRAISQGANLSASGIEAVCQYCDVRGLCRKGTW